MARKIEAENLYEYAPGTAVFFEAFDVLWMGVVKEETEDQLLVEVLTPIEGPTGWLDKSLIIKE